MKVTVLTTHFASKNVALCAGSVARQAGVDVEHRVIDAAAQDPPKTKIENLLALVAGLPADRVIAFVDGDDWLAHRGALERVAAQHERGAWVTFGSFVTSAGESGFAAPYAPHEGYRASSWRATHLKTMRAGLLQRVREEDLALPPGLAPQPAARSWAWIDRGDDPAFMWPALEMAGRDRTVFMGETLYVYDADHAWERSCSPAEKARELAIVDHVRKLPPYARIERL